MTANEMIEHLNKLVSRYGDREVVFLSGHGMPAGKHSVVVTASVLHYEDKVLPFEIWVPEET